MYIKPVYSLKIVLLWTRKYIYFFLLLSIAPVVLYDVVGLKWLCLPWLPIGLIGTALAFISGFKNNASYKRLWEARKIYGGIVNASRLLATMAISNCLFSPTLEIPAEFPTRCVLVKFSAKTRNYSYPRPIRSNSTFVTTTLIIIR
jgi:predicted membrane chloride channel (bestrophin family)